MRKLKIASKYLLGGLFILAGCNHFLHTSFYERIMPPYLPWHRPLVLISGVGEAGLGLGLLVPATARPAAWGLIALLVAVFPANLHMALHPEDFSEFCPALLYLRLPFQAVLIAWVAWHVRGASGRTPVAAANGAGAAS